MDNKTFRQLIGSYNAAYSNMGFDFAVGANNPLDLLLVIDKLKQESFTLKDIRVSARVLNHWKNNNILPLIRSGGWNKFSLLELVWIDIVIALREFGFPLAKITIARDQLFQPIKIDNQDKEVDINPFYQDMYAKHKQIYSFNLLAGYISYMIVTRKQVLLSVLSNGQCTLNYSGTFTPYSSSFITIPLFPLIQYFILDHANRAKMLDLGVITEEEQLIIDQVRYGKIKSLTIKFTENNQIQTIEAKTKVDLKELENKVGQIIAKGSYQKIEMQIENGKTVYATRDEKIYFKNK